jgi:hypothetical protein
MLLRLRQMPTDLCCRRLLSSIAEGRRKTTIYATDTSTDQARATTATHREKHRKLIASRQWRAGADTIQLARQHESGAAYVSLVVFLC